MKSAEAIPHIWVINLERSVERKLFMTTQLSKLSVDFSFINAVNGHKMPYKKMRKYSPVHALFSEGRLLSRGEIGCALSHVEIYHKIVNEDHNEILVLEDDVEILDDLINILIARDKFPFDWELINFRSDTKKEPLNKNPFWKEYRICRFLNAANRTGAYLINQSGAKKMLNHVYPIRYPADGILGRTHVTGLVAYGIEPEPVKLTQFPSDIWQFSQTASWDKKHWSLMMRVARKLQSWIKLSKRIINKLRY